jgi:predicted PhzF superfamily epimerase YddE/YHI9
VVDSMVFSTVRGWTLWTRHVGCRPLPLGAITHSRRRPKLRKQEWDASPPPSRGLDRDGLPRRTHRGATGAPALGEAYGDTIKVFANGPIHHFAVLADESAVRSFVPDMALIEALPLQGLAVTAPAEKGDYDFVSRYFAPRLGVPEDSATGSIHCALGPYWADRLGRSRLRARQVSRRGGDIEVAPRGDRVILAGVSVTVVDGTIRMYDAVTS